MNKSRPKEIYSYSKTFNIKRTYIYNLIFVDRKIKYIYPSSHPDGRKINFISFYSYLKTINTLKQNAKTRINQLKY